MCVCVCTGVAEKNEIFKQSISLMFSLMSSCKIIFFDHWFFCASTKVSVLRIKDFYFHNEDMKFCRDLKMQNVIIFS